MPEGPLTINTLLALIRGTKAVEKEVGKRTLMKVFAAQTQESAELPPVSPAFPRAGVGRTMVCPCARFLPLPGAARMLRGTHGRDLPPGAPLHGQSPGHGSAPLLPDIPH